MNMPLRRLLPFLFLVSALLPLAARAAAPQARTSPPAVYRMMLGDFEVTALSDGTVALPFLQYLRNIDEPSAQRLLATAFLADPVPTSKASERRSSICADGGA